MFLRTIIQFFSKRHGSLRPAIAGSLAVMFSAIAPCGAEQPRPNPAKVPPNIVLILADDLGAEALGSYGGSQFWSGEQRVGDVKTPHLDALARDGMRFEHCFATPVCSPSRAELLTGKYNHRIGFPHILGVLGATQSLDYRAHPTMAMHLKRLGYVTAAVGKWHLGPMEGKDAVPKSSHGDTAYSHPQAAGFDRQCLFSAAHLELYGKPERGSYTPDVLQDWTLRFLEGRRERKEPFFLYYASPLPHYPFLPTPLNPGGRGRDVDKMHGDPGNFPYLVEYLDQQVGEIVKKLDDLGMSQNTLLIFSGDNGTPKPMTTRMSDGRQIPWGKASLRDTGSWVPLIARWPGQVAAGAVSGSLVDFSDLLPTCLDLAGAPPAPDIDGVSFASELRGLQRTTRRWVHSFFSGKYFARDAHYKLRENGELYDVSGAPDEERLILPTEDTAPSAASRKALRAVLDRLHPPKPKSGPGFPRRATTNPRPVLSEFENSSPQPL